MFKSIKIQRNKLTKLGHKISMNNIHGMPSESGWFACENCDVIIYLDCKINTKKPLYYRDDLFFKNNGFPMFLTEFNLTCNEVIIMKIIE